MVLWAHLDLWEEFFVVLRDERIPFEKGFFHSLLLHFKVLLDERHLFRVIDACHFIHTSIWLQIRVRIVRIVVKIQCRSRLIRLLLLLTTIECRIDWWLWELWGPSWLHLHIPIVSKVLLWFHWNFHLRLVITHWDFRLGHRPFHLLILH